MLSPEVETSARCTFQRLSLLTMRQAPSPLWIRNFQEKRPCPPPKKDKTVCFKPSLPPGELVVFACAYSVAMKSRKEFRLHPRWGV